MDKHTAETSTVQFPELASKNAVSDVVGTPALSTPVDAVADQLLAEFHTVAVFLKYLLAIC